MATEKYYYNPPPGTPPFEFVFAGETHVFLPPDQIWKKEDEQYIIGKVPVRGVRPDAPESERWKAHYGTRRVWKVDEAATERLRNGLVPKPKNFLFLNEHQFRETQYARYRDLAQYIISQRKVQDDQDNELESLKREHARTMAELERSTERARTEAERLRAEAQKEAKLEAERIINDAKTEAAKTVAALAAAKDETDKELAAIRAELKALREKGDKQSETKPPVGPASTQRRG